MNKEQFKQLVKECKVGKKLPDAIYLHKDALEDIPPQLRNFIPAVANALKLNEEHWNLVKIYRNEFRLSLLHYPDFYTDSYPALHQSVNVDLEKLTHKITDYRHSDNPPILHRKETMISPNSEHFRHFKAITEEGETAGLYDNTRIIGFRQSWLNIIAKKGYQLIDGRLVENTNDCSTETQDNGIDRHKTAIVRHELSAPMKNLAKHGFLEGQYTLFDYGCGRGDDLRELQAHGLDAIGWDPVFQPDNEMLPSDIVNLGFVLNVIEERDERLEALLRAWELTEKILVVSVMLANETYIAQFQPYKDGVITSRNTFQKYYSQAEIKTYIEHSLGEGVIAVAPGIFYIFKDKLVEQAFLQARYSRQHQWKQLTSPIPVTEQDKARILITQHQSLFNDFWACALQYGRVPTNEEFAQNEQIRSLVGSHKKAMTLLKDMYDTAEFDIAQQARKEDLLCYFAMGLFDKRKPYIQQPDTLKQDIKAFFGNYKNALLMAKEVLFSIADTVKITAVCNQAHFELPASIRNADHSLIFHKRYLEQLPLLLRVYVGAAIQMYGELDGDIDLIKIHMKSGKLSLMGYDDFEGKAVPLLCERIKIKMAEQDIDFFDYQVHKRPPLLNKGLLVAKDDINYDKQTRFDKRLSKLLGLPTDEEIILTQAQWQALLDAQNKTVQGYRLVSLKPGREGN